MGNLCRLTGVEKTECPIKAMCLNCKYVDEREDGSWACTNKSVMEKGKAKILESLQVPDGYEIESIDIQMKPMQLKNPTKKCGAHEVDPYVLSNTMKEVFGPKCFETEE